MEDGRHKVLDNSMSEYRSKLSRLNLQVKKQLNSTNYMIALILTPMFAAAGYSLIYLLLGGGFGGAVLIFIVAKMFGK